MTDPRLAYLFQVYFTKTATAEERAEFMELLIHHENDELLKKVLEEAWYEAGTGNSESRLFSDSEGERMFAGILDKVGEHEPPPVTFLRKRTFPIVRFLAIAATVLFAVAGIYLWSGNRSSFKNFAKSPNGSRLKDSILPGGNKAVLTLADGSTIILDSLQKGTLAKQGTAKVMQLNIGTLAYNAGADNDEAIVYNTLSTPSGGQYQLILPDGTKVWLNSASSIHFPTIFKGAERNVSVTGEAYFEVAKNKNMPFKVTVKDMEIRVLGTHFNIMAYDDESSINTTLLEGSVKVSKNGLTKMLVPGQQSRINKTGDISIAEPDLDEVIAWKNGWFQFNGYDIQKVMRQIAKWYDVDVTYEGKIPTGHFSGVVSRSNDIKQVLKILQSGGVRFKIEGRRVIIIN